MKITALCPGCAKTLAVAAEHAGKKIRCPNCSGVVQLPEVASAPAVVTSVRAAAPLKAPAVVRSDKPRPVAPEPRVSNPPRERKRRNGEREQDLWSESLSSYSSPAIPDEQAEAYGLPPKRKKRKSSEEAESSSPYYYERQDVGVHHSRDETSLGVPLIMGGINVGCGLLFAVAELAAQGAAFYGFMVCSVIGLVLGLWGALSILKNAFEEDVLCGILYLVFGIYAIYYLFSRWEINRRPFQIYLIGLGSTTIACCMLFPTLKS